MSTEITKAAALMREIAAQASQGDWFAAGREDDDVPWHIWCDFPGVGAERLTAIHSDDETGDMDDRDGANARHIAAWMPAVAAAVADLLDEASSRTLDPRLHAKAQAVADAFTADRGGDPA